MKRNSGGDILSYDQYAQAEARGFAIPYIVEIEHAGQKLLFYGAEHTNDPAHPQFEDLESKWNNFVAETNMPVMLVEGRYNELPNDETSDKIGSIVRGGETQFAVHLARRDNVDVHSPEPDRLDEANQLAAEYGKDNVVFFYIMRQVAWWNRQAQKPDIKHEAAKMLEQMSNVYAWDGVDFSVEHISKMHQELFGKTLPWDNNSWSYQLTTPVSQQYVTNQLARTSGELRDQYLLRQIVDYWQDGKSPFIVFGSAHAVCLEPALQRALE